jgi:hypothetical protein
MAKPSTPSGDILVFETVLAARQHVGNVSRNR